MFIRMPMIRNFLSTLTLGIMMWLGVLPERAEASPSVSLLNNGEVAMENDLLSIQLSIKTQTSGNLGRGCGITALRFKPLDTEMVNVLYGQTDYLTGHLFGEVWDPVDWNGFRGGKVDTGLIYTPESWGVAEDGSAAMITQISEGNYRMERTVILRRDLATLEVRYRLTNVRAMPPASFSLRLHNIVSPSARGRMENRTEWVQLTTEDGPIAVDQSLSRTEFSKKYKGQKYFLPIWEQEPKRWWVSGKQPTPWLTRPWVAELGGKDGDGLVFLFSEEDLVGFYNSPGSSVEQVFRSQALRVGESWELTGYVGAFSGVGEGRQILEATPFYVATAPVSLSGGVLTGQMVPLFNGRFKVVKDSGEALCEVDASAAVPLSLSANGIPDKWRLEAYDRKGKKLGFVNPDGTYQLEKVNVPDEAPSASKVAGDVVTEGGDKVGAFLEQRDFVVYCDWNASDAEKKGAQRIADRLGVGVRWTPPVEGEKVIYVGNPDQNASLRDIGKFKHSLSSKWPGAGRGALLLYDNVELTTRPGLVIGGGDPAGVERALKKFEDVYLKGVTPPKGFVFQTSGIEEGVYPFSPVKIASSGDQVIRVNAARGEYEPTQVVVRAYEEMRGVTMTVDPLVHVETGKQISGKYLTPYRKGRGPVWVRWVDYAPLNLPNGDRGHPDPLIEKPPVDIPASTTRAVWLTFIVPEDAAAGLYRSKVTLEANGEKKEIPIELTVWDFTIPKTGVKGEPYFSYWAFPPDGRRWLRTEEVRDLTQNMVEHGMRVLHIGEDGEELFRWHFSPEGALKGKETDWFVVSEDGKVGLDTARFDKRVEQIDSAAKPFEIEYLIMLNGVLGWPSAIGEFEKTLPERFKGLPEREGHKYNSYYTQEMLTLLKEHLEKKGWLDRMSVKIGDEPPGFGWWWDSLTLAAREANIPFTTCLNNVDWKEAEVSFGSSMRWVQPLYMHYDKAFFEKARENGLQTGWYNCGPPPKIVVSAPASHIRSYLWQAAKADVDIVAWWGIQNWNYYSHGDIWNNKSAHFDSVMYPSHPNVTPWRSEGVMRDAAPIDSRRWEQIREGIEDTAYVKLLRERIADARKRGDVEKAAKGQAVLDEIWEEVFPTLNDYGPPYEKIHESREKVAQAIVELEPVKK